MTQIISTQDVLQNAPPAFFADLRPVPPAMTFERYLQLVLLARKYFGDVAASKALATAEADLLRKLFRNAEPGDLDLFHELRLARQIAIIGGQMRESCGLQDFSNEQLFDLALSACQIRFEVEQQ